MGRKKKPFTRSEPSLESRLIIIAVEGSCTEKIYFDTLVSKKHYYSPKIHVEVLPNTDNKSAPAYILENLKIFQKEYDVAEDDKLFLVIDRDQWEEQELSDVAQKCIQSEFQFIVSNPNIELWFLLHFSDVSVLPLDIQQKIVNNPKINKTRRYLEEELKKFMGSYNKSNPSFLKVMDKVSVAIENAKKLDTNPQERWPNNVGTRVYLVVEEIIKP